MIQKRPYRITFRLLNLCLACAASLSVYSETEKDSVKTQVKLQEVLVNGHNSQVVRAAMPVQLFTENEISRLNAASISDVAKHFAGVTVKDYGGIGGLKTVSLRGLGAQHTGVSYDGIMLSDIQSGQIDLSRFSLDNISDISLNNGQPNDIFQTARMFAAAGVLCLNTKLPEYDGKNQLRGNATVKTGSFGLFNPSLFMNRTFGKKWAMNVSADGILADGKYKFIQYYGSSSNIGEILSRKNSDVKSIRTELNTRFALHSNENILLKLNYYNSERGLPGPVVFYNSYSAKRLSENNFISQLHYENKESNKIQYQASAKYNRNFNSFLDKDSTYNDPGVQAGERHEKYTQNEIYLTSTVKYIYNDNLASALAVDWWYNNLFKYASNPFAKFNYPTRHNGLANFSTKYVTEFWSINGNLLYTLTREQVKTGVAAKNQNKLSPTIGLSYKPFKSREFRVRSYYKEEFRVPTFNDLYYQDFGNTSLRPEQTRQYDAGITFSSNTLLREAELSITSDFYYNNITDKIIAIPKDLFHWTMINKGKVDILGCDVTLDFRKKVSQKQVYIIFKGNYTFQDIKDVTPRSSTYGKQLIYSPKHTGGCSLALSGPGYEAGYNLCFVSSRLTDNYPFNTLKGYQDHSLFAQKKFNKLNIKCEVNNLLNKQFE
ncbi:MAG: TonB-dependent receptor, partial [Bacteroidota bacterium]|nr:TonB-dependent receptor [Bacteroidota bacterium]